MAIGRLVLMLLALVHLSKGGIVNVALNKPTEMSSIYTHHNSQTSVTADEGVDGDKRTTLLYVLHTAEVKPFAWRKVDLECPTGKYGIRCSNNCGQCAVRSSSCDRVTGVCPPGGCQPGWRGKNCLQGKDLITECPTGKYGVRCSNNCGQCAVITSSCDRVTGVCPPGGCQPGWRGDNCLQVCPTGKYGVRCSNSCGQCAVITSSCDRVTGVCPPGGCQPGWRGENCLQACPYRKYGVNCVEKCGHCNGTCDVVDGRCTEGCLEGYSGTHCTNKNKDDASGDVLEDSVTFYVIGGVIGFIIVLFLVIGFFFLLVRSERLQRMRGVTSEDSTQSAEMTNRFRPSSASERPQVTQRETIMMDRIHYDKLDTIDNRF